MICLVALAVFGVLGIFSVRYRLLAKEAFECVLRRVTLRKCKTGMDRRIKMWVTKKLSRFPGLARTVYRRFEIFSWAFTIAFFLSVFYSALSVYNILVHGSCDPGGGCFIAGGCGNPDCGPGCVCPAGHDCSAGCVEECSCGGCENESGKVQEGLSPSG